MQKWITKWMKETSGGVLEYLILLAMIGAVAAAISFRLYDQGWIIEEIAFNQYGVALGENEAQPISYEKVMQPLGNPIITMLPSVPPYTTSSGVKLAAVAYGGKPPYRFVWDNYEGGKEDGSVGTPRYYAQGSHDVAVTVIDAEGNERSNSLRLTIGKGLDALVQPKNEDGEDLEAPYVLDVPIRFDAIPENHSGAYTCVWAGDYIGNSDCTGVTEVYTEDRVVDVSVKLCDSTSQCVQKEKSFVIGDAPLQGKIISEAGTAITTSTYNRLKAEVSGGSGMYTVEWENYPSGAEGVGSYGDEIQYPSGEQVVKAKICDVNKPELGCIEPSITLQVTEAPPVYMPVDVQITLAPSRTTLFANEDVRLKATATGGRGEKNIEWSGYGEGSSLSGEWGGVERYSAGPKVITARACDEAGECVTETLNIDVVPYEPFQAVITSDPNRDIWDVESIRFKADVSGGTGDLNVTWSNYDGDGRSGVYGPSVALSVGRHTVSVEVCDAGVEEYPCEVFEKEIEVKRYIPLQSGIEISPMQPVFASTDDIRFRATGSDGSGSYRVTWINYAGGNGNGGAWGNPERFPKGTRTVVATVCDAIVQNQACSSSSYALTTYDEKTATLTLGESMNRTQTGSVGVSGLYRVKSCLVNTGSASCTGSGNTVSVTAASGDPVRSQWNSTKYSRYASDYLTSSSNSFPGSTYYSGYDGYSGSIGRSGSAYVSSGTYQPSGTKTVTAAEQYFTWTGGAVYVRSSSVSYWRYSYDTAFPTYYYTYPTDWEGYSGSCRLNSNRVNGYPLIDGIYFKNRGTAYYDSHGYRGGESLSWSELYRFSNTNCSVSRPAVDTRTYRQDYGGTVYMGGNDEYYRYNVTIVYYE